MNNLTEALSTITWGNLIDKVHEETGALVVYPDDLDLSATVGLRHVPYYAANLLEWAVWDYPVSIVYQKDGKTIRIKWRDVPYGIAEIVEAPSLIEEIEWISSEPPRRGEPEKVSDSTSETIYISQSIAPRIEEHWDDLPSLFEEENEN